MHLAIPLAVLAALSALIFYLGTGRFGRAQTQVWIDRLRAYPALQSRLNRHHGAIRAAGHYFQFGGLYLVVYWLYDAAFLSRRFAFAPIPALTIALICMAAAFADELHQLRSHTRQFRRVDFLHSTCGIALAALLVEYQSVLRGL